MLNLRVMKIAIEAQRIFRTKKHGMDFVALEMIRELQKADTVNEYWIIVAPGDDVCLQETPNFHIVTLSSGFYPLFEQVLLPREVRRIKPDLLHCTSNTAPLFPGCPLVVTLHDVIFLEKEAARNSSTYQRLGRIYSRFVVPKIIKKAKRIITVSKYEKSRITQVTGLPESKVSVVYNGFGTEFNLQAAEKSAGVASPGEYIFFLGAPNPKKNPVGTLKAYAEYLDRSKQKLPLRIADMDKELVRTMLQSFGREDVLEHIECPGYIPHSALPAAYGGAAAFLYTSLRESFGIPQLEAMACGTPVIVSNTSALPEIAGEGALTVDPASPAAIADALLRLEEDEAFRAEVINYGLKRIDAFSWKKTAEGAAAIYKEVISAK